MTRTAPGFTIYELLLSLTLLSVFLGSTYGALGQARRAQREADLYAADVTGLRRALDGLERDLRRGWNGYRVRPALLELGDLRDPVRWELRGGTLLRREPGGREEVVARNVAAFDVRRDGRGIRVALEPGRRRGPGGPAARLSTWVVPRTPEHRR